MGGPSRWRRPSLPSDATFFTTVTLASSAPNLAPQARAWTHTTQADFVAGEKHHLDVRILDALGTPHNYNNHPSGSVRLRSRPGKWTKRRANPVLDVGESHAWDNAVVDEAKMIFDSKVFRL